MGTMLHDSLLRAPMFGSRRLLSRILIKCGIAESRVNVFARRRKGEGAGKITFLSWIGWGVPFVASNMPAKGLILAAATIGITALLFLLNMRSINVRPEP